MRSRFPFSMENIPRQKSFACFSLKVGSILSATIIITRLTGNENLPVSKPSNPKTHLDAFYGRQRFWACRLRYKFIIVFSFVALGQCLQVLNVLPSQPLPEDAEIMMSYGVIILVTAVHAITLFITVIMLVGVLREQPYLIRPWMVWTSLQVLVSVLMFVFWSTMNIINHSGDSSLILYILEFLGLTLRFYMLMLVASFYKQLEEEKSETERLRNLVSSEAWYSSA